MVTSPQSELKEDEAEIHDAEIERLQTFKDGIGYDRGLLANMR